MALPIDQKEYLKRYLSAEPEDSKKKKRRRKVKVGIKVTRKFTIVDDDVDFTALASSSEKQDDIGNPLMDDETPLIAEFIDERPKEEVILEQYRTSNKWKTMGDDNQSKGSHHNSSDSDLYPGRSPASIRGDARGDRTSARPARHDSDSDLSPPRKGNDRRRDTRDDRPSARPARHDSDSDLSPPRKGNDRRGDTRDDRSSARPARHDSDSDLSPPRKGNDRRGDTRGDRPSARPARHDSDSDLTPIRKETDRRSGTKGDRPSAKLARHDSDSDLSPPRKESDRRRDTKGDRPSARLARHDSDSDLSPPRKGSDRRRDTKGDRPSARLARHDSDSDLSPPRKGSDKRRDTKGDRPSARLARHGSDSDLSPPRKGKDLRKDTRVERSLVRPPRQDSDSDLSPPRKGQDQRRNASGKRPYARPPRHDSDSDLSSPHLKHRRSQDLSPVGQAAPRKGRESREADLRRKREDSQARPSKGVSGNGRRPEKTLTGTTAGLSDAKSMRRENEESRRRDADMYSKMADDMSGKNAKTVFRDRSGRTRDLESEKRKKREEDAKKTQEDQKFVEWGKGVAQSSQQKELVQNALHEMDKPLARYQDDQDLDDMLKEKQREGDPMMAFLKKQQTKNQAAMGVKAKPKYRGPPPPPNRFNIMPGYRWDGVDRSSGFEKKAFERKADKKATTEIAFKWSTEDM